MRKKMDLKIVLVKHRLLKQLVLSYFRRDYPDMPDSKLMKKRTEFSIHFGDTNKNATIEDLVIVLRKTGMWAYCRHRKGGSKEIHYWLTKKRIKNKWRTLLEHIMHELVHASGINSEHTACKYAKLAEAAFDISKDIMTESVRKGKK